MLQGYAPQSAELKLERGARRGEEIEFFDQNGKRKKGVVLEMRNLATRLLALKPHQTGYWIDQPRKDRELTDEQKADDSPQLQAGLVVAVETTRDIVFVTISGEQRARRAFFHKRPFMANVGFDEKIRNLFNNAVVANVAVREMNPMETAESFDEVLRGIVQTGLAKDRQGAIKILVRRSEQPAKFTTDRLKLLNLIPELQQLVRLGFLKLGKALEIHTKYADDKAVQAKIANQLEAMEKRGQFDVREFQRILESDTTPNVSLEPGAARTAYIAKIASGATSRSGSRGRGSSISASPLRPVASIAPGQAKIRTLRTALGNVKRMAEDVKRGIEQGDGVTSVARGDKTALGNQVDEATNALTRLRKAIRDL